MYSVNSAFNKLCGSSHNMPRPSPPSVGAEEASRHRADRACSPQRSSRFPRSIRSHRCSCLAC